MDREGERVPDGKKNAVVPEISITCSWLEAKSSLSEAIVFKSREEEGDNEWCMGEADSCVLLRKNEASEEPLWIRFQSTDPAVILTKLHILSEITCVEVYGLFDEYIKTVGGELLDNVDGTSVFSFLLDDIGLTQLKLKFVRLKAATEIWLFGGCLWTKRDESLQKAGCGRINMTAVANRLDQGKFKLSPSADSLRKLVAEYIERGSDEGGSLPRFGGPSSAKPSQPFQNIDFIKTYMDSSLKNMENRLMNSLTEQMKELELRQNERFDRIFKLLESSSATSPTRLEP